MDNHQNVDSSIRTTSFTQQINTLFSTPAHPTPSKITQSTSSCITKMVRYSCHISFLKACRDHDLLPKGLRLKNPIGNTKTDTTIHKTGMELLKERLAYYRTQFHTKKCSYEKDLETLNGILDETTSMLRFSTISTIRDQQLSINNSSPNINGNSRI